MASGGAFSRCAYSAGLDATDRFRPKAALGAGQLTASSSLLGRGRKVRLTKHLTRSLMATSTPIRSGAAVSCQVQGNIIIYHPE